jgi:hypothetical protein
MRVSGVHTKWPVREQTDLVVITTGSAWAYPSLGHATWTRGPLNKGLVVLTEAVH